jgi:hypothetical protein
MVYEKETKKSMAYEIYDHFFMVYEIFAVVLKRDLSSLQSAADELSQFPTTTVYFAART